LRRPVEHGEPRPRVDPLQLSGLDAQRARLGAGGKARRARLRARQGGVEIALEHRRRRAGRGGKIGGDEAGEFAIAARPALFERADEMPGEQPVGLGAALGGGQRALQRLAPGIDGEEADHRALRLAARRLDPHRRAPGGRGGRGGRGLGHAERRARDRARNARPRPRHRAGVAGVDDDEEARSARADACQRAAQLLVEDGVADRARRLVVAPGVLRQQRLRAPAGLRRGPLLDGALGLRRAVPRIMHDHAVARPRLGGEGGERVENRRARRRPRRPRAVRRLGQPVGQHRRVLAREAAPRQQPPQQRHVVARPFERADRWIVVAADADQQGEIARLSGRGEGEDEREGEAGENHGAKVRPRPPAIKAQEDDKSRHAPPIPAALEIDSSISRDHGASADTGQGLCPLV
jgi:hypothetical protein